jgi:signal transduction histidine kinase/CheY-like chemotaxis protein
MKKIYSRIICLLLLFAVTLSLSVPAYAADTSKKIRVGWYEVDGLQEKDGNTYSGYNYDYLMALSQYTGWDYEFVSGTWQQCYDMLRNGEIDILGGVDMTDQRKTEVSFSQFSEGYGGSRVICRRDDDRFIYGNMSSWNGAKIGCVTGTSRTDSFSALCKSNGISPDTVLITDQKKMQKMLSSGQLDLAVVSQSRSINGFRSVLDFDPAPYYFATAPGESDILSSLNYALGQINSLQPDFSNYLSKKYFTSSSSLSDIVLTSDEKEYIKKHPVITVAYDPAWAPIEYKDESTGQMNGIMRDIYDRISKATGLKFNFVTSDSFYKARGKYKEQADMFSSLSYDYNWGKKLGYTLTSPFLSLQVVQLYKNEPGKVIALPIGYYLTKCVKEKYTGDGYKYKLYPTVRECVDAVYKGDADSTFINSLELNYYLSEAKYSNLTSNTVLGFQQEISIAVGRNEDEELYSIMNKAVNSISDEQLSQAIAENSKSRNTKFTDLIYTDPLIAVVFIFIFVILLLGFIFFIYKSKTETKRNAQLAKLNADLRSSDNAKNEFLSRMSHDIRTPMNGIIGMTRIAKKQKNPEKTAQCLEKIDVSSGYMLGLLNDILDMTKIESGDIKLSQEPYVYEEFETYLQSVIRPLCEIKHQDFTVTGTPDSEFAPLVDKLRFNQILFNLLSNASKYTPENGKIEFGFKENCRNGKMHMTLTVTDTGIGMTSDFMKIMFEPFAQETRAHKDETSVGTTGLGLAIVKQIVDAMGGTISVKSEPMKGSSFTVELELACISINEISQKKQARITKDDAFLSGKNILLCEDNEINREIAKELLSEKNIGVKLCENGLEGCKAFDESSPFQYDAVITDIRMPLCDGFELLDHIRSSARADAKAIPVIAMTANAYETDIKTCIQRGMSAHVPKPIDPDVLYETLISVLSEK